MPIADSIAIQPLQRRPVAIIRVPGSKSITNRAFVLAALAARSGSCRLQGILHSEDTEVMAACLRELGFDVETDWFRATATVAAPPGDRLIPANTADLFCANSGTTMRFLTAMVALGRGRFHLDGIPRMRQRPIEDLLAALRQLGAKAYSEHGNGCPPVLVEANGLAGGSTRVRGDLSSQFLSSLLMAAPMARGDVLIEVDGPLVSQPYVTMTIRMIETFGGSIAADVSPVGGQRFSVPGRQQLKAETYAIEPDASAASYFFGAAAITGGQVTVSGLHSSSLQGDVRFVEVLERMGCEVKDEAEGMTVTGRPLHGIDVDMNSISDTVMTLAAVACFASGPTTIRNVAHIRHKETDRLVALANELRRAGAEVHEFADGLTIIPKPLQGAIIETYNDHRMAMSMSLLGLRVPRIVILNPACVGKTYPGFFDDLEKLRTQVFERGE
jgi:3-phosphoshikimate 1-carboxyvinyltransferase